MGKADAGSAHRKKKTICLPFSQEIYEKYVINPTDFRRCIDQRIDLFPELFPSEIAEGYRMKDMYWSKKQGIPTRRIEISGTPYTIRPSFVMPYMTGIVDEVEKGLFLRKFNVPFWGLSYVFGKDPMYWYRIEKSLGRNSIVGTTVRKPEDIPQHLAADEKHTWILGDKVYVATTVGKECILGVSIAKDAGEEALKAGYGVFKDEARCLNPDYHAETVNTDGWKATRNAWSYLFASAVILCCFLHVFIKIRDRAKKKYRDIFLCVSSKLWDCYRAENKGQFSQRLRRLVEWCRKEKLPSMILDPIDKLRKNIKVYSAVYDYPKAHRTSNMVDRLMQRMDRHLFSTQYFHGYLSEAELSIRGWALIQNFAPSNPQTVKKHDGYLSPAERLNRFRYHDTWLHNLLISASLGGYRSPPLKPI
jgi:hypothetical protein